MEAKDTVMKERGVDYDANCGQMIACDILPKYVIGSNQRESCYLEISKVIEEFVESERKAQAEIYFKAGYRQGQLDSYTIDFAEGKRTGIREVAEWVEEDRYEVNQKNIPELGIIPVSLIHLERWQTKLKEWRIDGEL